MARSRWIYINGVGIPADDYEALARARGHSNESGSSVRILPDLPDFVSPIDGKRYSGRAGLREHCSIHNVVPTADLAGLPPKPTNFVPQRSRSQVAADKQHLAHIINSYKG